MLYCHVYTLSIHCSLSYMWRLGFESCLRRIFFQPKTGFSLSPQQPFIITFPLARFDRNTVEEAEEPSTIHAYISAQKENNFYDFMLASMDDETSKNSVNSYRITRKSSSSETSTLFLQEALRLHFKMYRVLFF